MYPLGPGTEAIEFFWTIRSNPTYDRLVPVGRLSFMKPSES